MSTMLIQHSPRRFSRLFLQTLETELPDTAASMRLSSLELSDCLNELGGLGSDISGGVRASARLLTTTEAGVRQGVQLIGVGLIPALAKRETQIRGALTYCKGGITMQTYDAGTEHSTTSCNRH